MSESRVPFNRPSLVGPELEQIALAIDQGWAGADGSFTKKSEALLENLLDVPRALLTTSCTHALELAALALDVQPGDEVVVPAFTFVSTANAFALRGAKIIFLDVRRDTLNLDESQLEAVLTPRTKAIVPVHYAGVGCEMDVIMEVADRSGVAVVEDNAHGLFGRYKGQLLGTFGQLAALSFHETKNIISGEGGALLVNDPSLIDRVEQIRQKGTNRLQFLRGEVDKYEWVGLGSSYGLSDILAAFLLTQLEGREQIFEKRRRIWHHYQQRLEEWAQLRGVQLLTVPDHCEQTFHLYALTFADRQRRDEALSHLNSRGIHAVFHYTPLHLSPAGRRFGAAPLGCPITEDVSGRLLRLPFYNDLDEQTQDRVVDALFDLPES